MRLSETHAERAAAAAAWLERLRSEVGRVIVGQQHLVDRLLIGLLANGHVLLEGVPGLAKTLAVRTLAAALHATFQRIQFTPDLLPADIIGTLIYNPQDGRYHATQGPVFAHLVLADEINRAPAKVQSALLEAMQERQVTLGVAFRIVSVKFFHRVSGGSGGLLRDHAWIFVGPWPWKIFGTGIGRVLNPGWEGVYRNASLIWRRHSKARCRPRCCSEAGNADGSEG